MKIILSVIILFVTLSCRGGQDSGVLFEPYGALRPSHDAPATSLEAQLSNLKNADPESDARRAMNQGDRRLVAIMGVGLAVPGVQMNGYLERRIGLKIVVGTTDNIITEAQGDLVQLAYVYARKYNQELLILLTTIGSAIVSGNVDTLRTVTKPEHEPAAHAGPARTGQAADVEVPPPPERP